ncbi:phosphotransferase system, mannose/fructose/N-acetylgalactosamine-specific component IID [Lachnospiraceae bacterium JC7]|nr:phosphotransferase system, mannose/fructose/N-acetylgalactosamine-specific component IID [Lachnospiraceae bacterium JC7]
MSVDKKVSEFRRNWQFFWRSWAIQCSWNYERQMDMGFMYGIAPTLERLYPDETDPRQLQYKKEAYRRHMVFYNCTPQTSAFALGLAASMEEELAADRDNFNPDTINAVKTSLMGPLSGVGDSFFQGTIRVIAFGLGVSLAQRGSILGPVLAMLISFIPSWIVTWFAGKLGYTMGAKYLNKLQGGLMDRLMYICGIVGLMVVGGMVASMIGLTTPITFSATGLVLQDILDTIIPGLLSLCAAMGLYFLVRKQIKSTYLLLICIVGGIVFNALGILA